MSEPLADRAEAWPVTGHRVLGRGRVCTFVEDELAAPDGGEPFRRQYLTHPGAVGIIAVDDRDRIAVVRQYRHPVGMVLVEPPAGLLDVADEPPLLAAQRELAEEVGLAADTWRVLVDVATSPGGSEESARVFLATDLREAPRPDGFVLADEEAHMTPGWEAFDDVVDGVLAGRLQSPLLVAGVMALAAARATGRELRDADSPWPVRAIHAGQHRERA
ncbi:NUDIX domain-containing protein [Aestuariimicrobium soli]|uniref:NUDIX domain-containing protein n=1 Tax=Aestuariimicrobium soli TaxID=2035834 RepID=UPI003EBC7701